MSKVAILGFGVVGSGVAEVLTRNSGPIGLRAGENISLKYILDVRDFPGSPYGDKFVKDFSVIEQDPEVEIVVETIGGAAAALELTRRALEAGKSVVSSNKELVAAHGCELLELAARKGVVYLFEASVGGGIPILRPLSQCLAANRIREIRGILNGTTNYILTRMIGTGLSFEDALKEAQEKGYAERDPSADVEGLDACRKICILADLAFGQEVPPAEVPTAGITAISLADVFYADSANMKIKLLGRARLLEDGRVMAFVEPHLVPLRDPLSGVDDVFNAITVRGDAIGDVMFYGRGAGKLPTASAVVADVMDVARHRQDRGKGRRWEAAVPGYVTGPDELASQWYVRLEGEAGRMDPLGSVTVLARAGAPGNEVGLLTGPMTRTDLTARLAGRKILSLIRVLDESADLA